MIFRLVYLLDGIIIGVMEQAPHIFIPHSDTLQARVEAYQRVVRDYNRFIADCSRLSADTLGDQADVRQAQQIYVNSLKQAQKAVDSRDLQNAKSHGYLSDDDIRSFVQTQRSAEIQAQRSAQQSQQTNHQQRR